MSGKHPCWLVITIGLLVELMAGSAVAKPSIIVVIGAAGERQYGEDFQKWAEHWRSHAEKADAELTIVGNHDDTATDPGESDRERLRSALESASTSEASTIWLVLIGHGTFLPDEAKFNLRGPDVSAKELDEWLTPIAQPLVVVNGASASGPFINRLSREGRTIITATQSGMEDNYARFAGFFAEAMGSPDADLDHDDEVSLLEAFLHAAGAVRRFYEDESRLSTEHPLIDDNGDGLGTPASLFDGVYAQPPKDPKRQADGRDASRIALIPATDRLEFNEQELEERERIERELDVLRAQRDQLSEAEFDQRLEALLTPLAELYHQAEQRAESPER